MRVVPVKKCRMLPKMDRDNGSICFSCGKQTVSNSSHHEQPPIIPSSKRPCPKDLSSSYRSTPTIYNPSNQSTLNSSPYDDVQSMKEATYNQHTLNHHLPNDHTLDFEEKIYTVNLNLIPVFILEVIAVASLAALAYFLRCKEKFAVYERGFHCSEKSTLSLPLNSSATSIFNLQPNTLYIACVTVPLVAVIIGEVGYFLFSETKKVIRGGCVGCRLHLSTRRIIRFSGTFLFGLFVTSIITDALKFSTGRLRPYFLTVCNSIVCTQDVFTYAWPEDVTCNGNPEEIKELRMSFPSYHASLSAYAGVYVMIYLHNILSVKASRLLRPSLEVTVALLVLLCGTVRISMHHSHWEDVFFGFIIGTAIAIHLCKSTLQCFQEHRQPQHQKCCQFEVKRVDVPKTSPPPPPFFFRYFRIPHVSYQNKSSMSYSIDNTEDYSPKPAINEAFQKDLHQRIEDYNKRQGYTT